MIIQLILISLAACDSAIFDPALFLAPFPPLTVTSDGTPPGQLWDKPLEIQARDIIGTVVAEDTTEKPTAAESRMFWPRFNAPKPSITIPLTFSLSGSYGKSPSTGVIGNTYVAGIGTSVAGLSSSVAGLGTSVAGVGTGVAGLATSVAGGRDSVAGLRSSVAGLGWGVGAGSSGLTKASMYGRSGLAGSSYGVRVYGGDNTAAWGGWGNGKWGHYGKG